MTWLWLLAPSALVLAIGCIRGRQRTRNRQPDRLVREVESVPVHGAING